MNNKVAAVLLGALVMGSTGVWANEPEELMWDALAPKIINEASGGDEDSLYADQQWDWTRPVETLNGKFVKIPGFIVPLESDEGGLLTEFLLVPYFGACIHTPPPPPNQIVFVKLKEAFNLESMYQPYWITGIMSTQKYDGYLAESLYTLDGQQVEEYEY